MSKNIELGQKQEIEFTFDITIDIARGRADREKKKTKKLIDHLGEEARTRIEELSKSLKDDYGVHLPKSIDVEILGDGFDNFVHGVEHVIKYTPATNNLSEVRKTITKIEGKKFMPLPKNQQLELIVDSMLGPEEWIEYELKIINALEKAAQKAQKSDPASSPIPQKQ